MTTLTSRSLPLVPLQLNMGPIGAADSMLHTDGRLLHNHMLTGATNRLQADTLRLPSPKEERISPHSRYGSEHSFKHSICDLERASDVQKLIAHDEMSDARSCSVSSYMADSLHKEHDDDQMSYCSDESELSVGKEVESEHAFDKQQDDDDENGRRKRHNENESINYLYQSSRLTEKLPHCPTDDASNEALRYANKVPNTIIRPSPTRIQEEFLRKSQLYAEELMKHQMNFMAATRGLNVSPKINEHSFGYPVRPDTISPIRAAAAVAAAAGGPIGDDPTHHHHVNSRAGFRPHIRISADLEQKWNTIDDRNSQSPEGTSFRGIHSHLNAISRITLALGRDMTNLTSPVGSLTSRENSQSPPNHLHQLLNNNVNDTNLKFSIDNILKPGFGAGRRITDPLLKRIKGGRKNAQRAPAITKEHVTPMDLTAAPPSTTPLSTAPPSPASSEQDKVTATNNNNKESSSNPSGTGSSSSSSGGPMVWPAWVYCTRYSDRPSSGMIEFICFFYNILFLCLAQLDQNNLMIFSKSVFFELKIIDSQLTFNLITCNY